MKSHLALALAVMASMCAPAQTTRPDPEEKALIGDWRGDSICVVRESACRDEKALYRIKTGSQPNHFSVVGDKIVNGQAVNMGTSDCAYSPREHTLTCELPRGVIHLTLEGARLEGNMKLTDGTLWRNITLKKDSA